jgi:hypothetical protein
MAEAWGIDAAGLTPDAAEEAHAIPGAHLMTIQNVEIIDNGAAMAITYRINSPPCTGVVLRPEKFNNAKFAASSEDMAKQSKRFRIWAIRVGLVRKEDYVMDQKTGLIISCPPIDPTKAIGRQLVVVCVNDSYVNKDGKVVQTCKPGYVANSIFPLDHPEIPVEDRIRLGLPLLPGQVAPSAGGNGTTPSAGAPAFDPAELV